MVRFRRGAVAFAGVTAASVAVALVGGSAASAAGSGTGVVGPVATAPACSTDIIARGSLAAASGRHLEFSYLLAGGECRLSVYALIVRNNYDPKQIAVFARLGDGKSKEVIFSQDLPFTPTQRSESGAVVPGTAGLCVIGVTTQGLRISDIAPDPEDAPCEPLKGIGARAFH